MLYRTTAAFWCTFTPVEHFSRAVGRSAVIIWHVYEVDGVDRTFIVLTHRSNSSIHHGLWTITYFQPYCYLQLSLSAKHVASLITDGKQSDVDDSVPFVFTLSAKSIFYLSCFIPFTDHSVNDIHYSWCPISLLHLGTKIMLSLLFPLTTGS